MGNAVVLCLLSIIFSLRSLFQLLKVSQKDLLKFARLNVNFHFCFQQLGTNFLPSCFASPQLTWAIVTLCCLLGCNESHAVACSCSQPCLLLPSFSFGTCVSSVWWLVVSDACVQPLFSVSDEPLVSRVELN